MANEEQIEQGRRVVLDALDDFALTLGLTPGSGWKDAELPELFRAVDAQINHIVARAEVRS